LIVPDRGCHIGGVPGQVDAKRLGEIFTEETETETETETGTISAPVSVSVLCF
jgi:hypothetical protein